MSLSIGTVWVLPLGAATNPEQVEITLASWLAGATRRTSKTGDYWDLPGLADASMFLRTNDTGFDLLVVRFSSSELTANPVAIRAWLDQGFHAARGLGALFGLLTRYPGNFEPEWLREHVLIPLLMEEWGALRKLPVEAIWVGDAGE